MDGYTSIWATWLGQGGFVFEFQGTRLLIDPFLSDVVEQRQGLKRLVPPPLEIGELKPDHIFITHAHLDHLDPLALPEIHRQYPEVAILGPSSVVQKAMELGIPKSILVEVFKNDTYPLGTMELKIAPAYHSDPFSVGCIIQFGTKQVYFSADTLHTEGLVGEILQLAEGEIHGAIVCINGKLGNMDWSEAVSLVTDLHPTLALPMHYGMFRENTEDPLPFIEACRSNGISSFEPILGERIKLLI